MRTALVALDQMEGGRLDPAFVAGLLSSADPMLKETASWIVGRHREWAGALAGVLGRAAGSARPLRRRAGRAGKAARPAGAGGADPGASGRPAARRLRLARRPAEQLAGHGLVGPERKTGARRLDLGPGERARRQSVACRARSTGRGGRAQPCRWPGASGEPALARSASDRRRRQESRRASLERTRRRAGRPGQTR